MGLDGNPLEAYAVNGLTPETVADFAAVKSASPLYAYDGVVRTGFEDVFTFARASAAWMVNSEGNLVEVASGVPRTDSYRYNGTSFVRKGLRLESEQRTNSCLHSRAFDNAAWGNLGTPIVTANEVGIDGAANTAYTIEDDDAATIEGRQQNITVADDNNPSAVSFYVGKTSSASSFPGLGVRYAGGTTALYQVTVNTDVGTTTTRSTSSAPDNVFVENWSASYWRITIVGANNGTGNTSLSAQVFPAVNTDASGTWSAATTGSAVFDQCDVNIGASTPSSPIITGASAVTRAAETLTIAAAKMAANTTGMSFQIQGEIDYADEGAAAQVTFMRWQSDASNFISIDMDTNGASTGEINANQGATGSGSDSVAAAAEYTPGLNVPFNIASRNTSVAINVAKDGVAGTADTTPTALADLSAVNFELGQDFNGHISMFRQWGVDIADAGIEEATA